MIRLEGGKALVPCKISTVIYRLQKIPEIDIVGESQVSVVAFGSKKFNIFRLSDALAELGWSLNPLQFPAR